MIGLFYIKNETFGIERGKLWHKYEACGDLGWAKEVMFMKVQTIIDRMVNHDWKNIIDRCEAEPK